MTVYIHGRLWFKYTFGDITAMMHEEFGPETHKLTAGIVRNVWWAHIRPATLGDRGGNSSMHQPDIPGRTPMPPLRSLGLLPRGWYPNRANSHTVPSDPNSAVPNEVARDRPRQYTPELGHLLRSQNPRLILRWFNQGFEQEARWTRRARRRNERTGVVGASESW